MLHPTANTDRFISPAPQMGRGVAVDLFSGMGGLSIGLEGAGFDIAAGFDAEASAALAHHENFPYGRSYHTDLGEVHGGKLRDASGLMDDDIDVLGCGASPTAPGQIALLAGGPPCQGFSSMGRRDPQDPRSSLLGHFARLVVEMQPRYAVAENVPNLLRDPSFRPHLEAFYGILEQGGYRIVEPRVVRALDFGVPQARERVVFLIYKHGEVAPDYPVPTHGMEEGLKSFNTVRDALGDLPDPEQFPELWATDTVATSAGDWGSPSPYGMLMRGLANDPDDLSYPRSFDGSLLTRSNLTRHAEARIAQYLHAAPGEMVMPDKLKKLDWESYAPTLRAGSGRHTAARPVHPGAGRVITVREAARLSSFPDWMMPHPRKIWGFREVGNAVPYLLGRAIGHEIRKAAGIEARQPSVSFAGPDPRVALPTGNAAISAADKLAA